MIQPKTAIACRDDVELSVCLDILKREGHTTDFRELKAPARIYVCPEGYKNWTDDKHDDLQQTNGQDGEDIDDFEVDEDDDFEWNYVEAADILRNQIISARLKGGHNVT